MLFDYMSDPAKCNFCGQELSSNLELSSSLKLQLELSSDMQNPYCKHARANSATCVLSEAASNT